MKRLPSPPRSTKARVFLNCKILYGFPCSITISPTCFFNKTTGLGDLDLDFDRDLDFDLDFDRDLDFDLDFDLDLDLDFDLDLDLDFDLDFDFDLESTIITSSSSDSDSDSGFSGREAYLTIQVLPSSLIAFTRSGLNLIIVYLCPLYMNESFRAYPLNSLCLGKL